MHRIDVNEWPPIRILAHHGGPLRSARTAAMMTRGRPEMRSVVMGYKSGDLIIIGS